MEVSLAYRVIGPVDAALQDCGGALDGVGVDEAAQLRVLADGVVYLGVAAEVRPQRPVDHRLGQSSGTTLATRPHSNPAGAGGQ